MEHSGEVLGEEAFEDGEVRGKGCEACFSGGPEGCEWVVVGWIVGDGNSVETGEADDGDDADKAWMNG